MTGTDHEDDDALAAEYALGLLSPEDADAFEARMAAEPALRAAYAFWAERFAAFAADLPEEPPPPTAFEDIEDRLFPLHRRRERGFLGNLRGLMTAGLAVAVLVVALLLWPAGEPSVSPDFRVELAHSDTFNVIGVGATRDGVFHLILTDYVEPPEDEDYELWLVAGDDPPVSLGLVPRGETGDYWTELPAGITAAFAGGALAVSLEPAGGSPDGTPTTVLVAGEITEL